MDCALRLRRVYISPSCYYNVVLMLALQFLTFSLMDRFSTGTQGNVWVGCLVIESSCRDGL